MIDKIVLVKFPFSDLASTKKRPALILREIKVGRIHLVQISMITSRVSGLKFPRDIKLKNWQSAGLLHESVLRLDKIATIEHSLIEKSLGALAPADRALVAKMLKGYFS